MTRHKKFLSAGLAFVFAAAFAGATLFSSAASAKYDPGWQNWWNQYQDKKTMLDQQVQSHTALGLNALRAEIQAAPDAAAAKASLTTNTAELAATVNFWYPGAQAQFQDLWAQHIQLYSDYLAAALANDQAGKDAAKASLVNVKNDLGHLLEAKNHKIHEDNFRAEFAHHTDLTLSIIDKSLVDDYDGAYADVQSALKQTDEFVTNLLPTFHHNGHEWDWKGYSHKHHDD